MKSEKGILTVEATIILSVLIFFITFILSFGRVYMAQYYVTHGLLQTTKALSFKAYKYETTEASTLTFLKDIVSMNDDVIVKGMWNTGNIEAALKETYKNVVVDCDSQLKNYGLEKGLDTLNFEEAKKEGKNLLVKVNYQVKLPFGFFGHENITLHQEIKTGLWAH